MYPGEPNRFHSQFILVCFEFEARSFGTLTLKELITYARMATSVKKTFVLSYLCEKTSSLDNSEIRQLGIPIDKISIKINDSLDLILISINWSHI